MIKTETVDVPEVKAHKRDVNICYCDFCGKRVQSWQTCVVCKKQVCRGFTKACRRDDPRCTGDYPDPYCPLCYEIKFERFDKDYQNAEVEYDKKVEFLDKLVLETSLEEYDKKFPKQQDPQN